LRKIINYVNASQPRKFILGGFPGVALNLLIIFLSSQHGTQGKELLLITAISFFMKELISFAIHKTWTFKEVGEIIRVTTKEAVYYLMVSITITIANAFIFFIVVDIFNFHYPTSTQLAIHFCSFFVNFLTSKEIFKP